MNVHLILKLLFIFSLLQIITACKDEELPTLSTSSISNIAATSAIGGGIIISDGNASITSRGVCWSQNTNPTISDSKTNDGTGVGQFVSTLKTLTAGSTYHVRAFATNSVGTAYGADLSFTTLGKAPECLSQTATNITPSGATLNGTVNANYLSTTVTFEYGTSTSYGQSVTSAQSPVAGNSITNVSAYLSNLTPGTTYHFRVETINSLGTTYGNDMTFTTLGAAPNAATLPAINISETGATLSGGVSSNYLPTEIVFEYGLTISYGNIIAVDTIPQDRYTEVFANVSGLITSTTYHYRVKATNALGTAYGNDLTFTPMVLDHDGNYYNVVTIGSQIWFRENLKTTIFNDGTQIPLITDNTAWGNPTPGYCWYNNDRDTYGKIYGALYNGFAISPSFNGNKSVCPTGWHVPTEAEWNILENYLIVSGFNFDGTTTDNKIAKSLATTTNWEPSTIQGTVGNTDYPEKRNLTGFSAFPAGDRWPDGFFWGYGTNTIWWNTSEDIFFGECYRAINNESVSLNYGTSYPRDHRYYGFSVRCIKD